MVERVKVLITVKTYPLPSTKYEETVCTAGVLEDGSFVRLYPIDYRNRPYHQWYEKYQWVETTIEKNPKDPRPESYRPFDITPIGNPLKSQPNWEERKKYVLAKDISTMCDLEQIGDQSQVSLGIIKPKLVKDFIVEPTVRDWKPEVLTRMRQMHLFDKKRNPIEKIPYKFSYVFFCEDPACKGHTKMIEDWEVGALYRKMRDNYGDEKVACDKVKQRFFDTMCAPGIDTHFFVGTVLEFGTWVILGVFWPKKI